MPFLQDLKKASKHNFRALVIFLKEFDFLSCISQSIFTGIGELESWNGPRADSVQYVC